jgi:EAL domain-containing protein (putative c-di-GMP-specific phosphodiesterase class I)
MVALEHLGCDAVQGYLIATPLPAARFEAWLADGAGQWEQPGAAGVPQSSG